MPCSCLNLLWWHRQIIWLFMSSLGWVKQICTTKVCIGCQVARLLCAQFTLIFHHLFIASCDLKSCSDRHSITVATYLFLLCKWPQDRSKMMFIYITLSKFIETHLFDWFAFGCEVYFYLSRQKMRQIAYKAQTSRIILCKLWEHLFLVLVFQFM